MVSFASILNHIANCSDCTDDEWLNAKLAAYHAETYPLHATYLRNDISSYVAVIHAEQNARRLELAIESFKSIQH